MRKILYRSRERDAADIEAERDENVYDYLRLVVDKQSDRLKQLVQAYEIVHNDLTFDELLLLRRKITQTIKQIAGVVFIDYRVLRNQMAAIACNGKIEELKAKRDEVTKAKNAKEFLRKLMQKQQDAAKEAAKIAFDLTENDYENENNESNCEGHYCRCCNQ
jgi:hypothetical protein